MSDWSVETSEEESDLESVAVTDFHGNSNGGLYAGKENSMSVALHKRGKSKASKDDLDLAHKFNALRFLAMNLKSQNDTMNK